MELVLDRVTKQFKNKIAADRISLALHAGIYGLLGANGSGKTTLMRMICGILDPTSGEVTYDGQPVSGREYREVLGYLPQDFGYYPDFTARDFLLYMASLKGLAKREARQRAARLLKLVDLSAAAKKKIKTFSGGMKRRLGIAQALLNNPRVLILDEPTAGLDPKERIRFRNLIARLGKDKIILLSTHIVSDIEDIASMILVMKNGRIIHKGSLGQIIREIEGRVYECRIGPDSAEQFMAQYPVINVRQLTDGYQLRVIAGQPPTSQATAVPATLEDLYLYYFSEEENHDEESGQPDQI